MSHHTPPKTVFPSHSLSPLPLSSRLQVSGLEMRKWVDELFVIIMDMLQDSSLLAKRQVRAAECAGLPGDRGLGTSFSVHHSVTSQFLQRLTDSKSLTFSLNVERGQNVRTSFGRPPDQSPAVQSRPSIALSSAQRKMQSARQSPDWSEPWLPSEEAGSDTDYGGRQLLLTLPATGGY